MTHRPIGADDVSGELPAVVEDRIHGWVDLEQDRAVDAETALGDSIATLQQLGSLADTYNDGGAFTYLTSSPQGVPGAVLMVQPNPGDVWLEWQIQLAVITSGQGATVSLVYETTDGVAVQRGAPARVHHNTGDAPTVNGDTLKGSAHIGSVTETRLFVLYGFNVQEGSSLQTAFVNSTYGPTMFRAVAS